MIQNDIANRLYEGRIVSILRKIDSDKLIKVIDALAEGGIKCFEITADSENVFESIRALKRHYGSSIILGAGTILEPISCRMAIDAGAEYIVTPILNTEVIKMASMYGKPCMPGCMTPTEMLSAYQNGAEMVKVFPASSLGVDYFKNIKGPLGHIPVMATGGIGVENVGQFVKAGVKCFGIGSSLTDKEAINKEDYGRLTQLARAFYEKVFNK